MIPVLMTPPAVEPVTLAQMKAYLRLDTDAEDDLVSAMITAARLMVEASARRMLIDQTWRLVFDAWPSDRKIRLPLSPLIAVTQIRVFDAAGQPAILPSSSYDFVSHAEPPFIVLDHPPEPGRPFQGIEIDIRVGYGPAAVNVPAPLIQAIRTLAARWFDNRGDVADGIEPALPPAVLALVSPYRQKRVA